MDKNSPADFDILSYQPRPNLDLISRRLKQNSNPRRYSPKSSVSEHGSSGSATPPLNDLQVFKGLCREYNDEEIRKSIDNPNYHQEDAYFFFQGVQKSESECILDRQELNQAITNNTEFWRLRSSFWREEWRRQKGSSPSTERYRINYAPYWRYEYCHFRDATERSKHSTVVAQPAFVKSRPTESIPLVLSPSCGSKSPISSPIDYCSTPPTLALRRSSRLRIKREAKIRLRATANDGGNAEEARVQKSQQADWQGKNVAPKEKNGVVSRVKRIQTRAKLGRKRPHTCRSSICVENNS